VRPEAVLVVGHAAVEPGLELPGRVARQVNLAVVCVERGQHLHFFEAHGNDVARVLGHLGLDDAVVEGVSGSVLGQGDGCAGRLRGGQRRGEHQQQAQTGGDGQRGLGSDEE
jgi:hypothetical protein